MLFYNLQLLGMYYGYIVLLSVGPEASSQLPANSDSRSQADSHTHPNGNEWIQIPNGGGQGGWGSYLIVVHNTLYWLGQLVMT